MFEIIVEYDNGMEQQAFGNYETAEEAYIAMQEIIKNYSDFDWIQISKVR